MKNKEERDPQDQASETSTYQNEAIIQQRGEGLLSRWEADVNDILATKEVVFSISASSNEAGQALLHNELALQVLISQIYIHCLWNDVPMLRQWISRFLAGRQPDATILAAGMAKQGVTKIAQNEQQAIEGYLVIGSSEQELHGSVAEQLVEHLVAEGQVHGYAIYTIPVVLY